MWSGVFIYDCEFDVTGLKGIILEIESFYTVGSKVSTVFGIIDSCEFLVTALGGIILRWSVLAVGYQVNTVFDIICI